QVVADGRRRGDLLDRLGAVRRPGDERPAVLVDDVLGVGLEHVRGDPPRLGLDPLQRVVDGDGADGGAAAAVGAVAEGRAERVAVLDGDVVESDAELVGHDLRHRRLVPLPERLAAGRDDDLAGQVHAYVGALPEAGTPALAGGSDPRRWRDTADLDVAREADAEIAALLARLRLVAPEAVVVDELECPVERALVLAAVVGEAGEDARVVRE